MGQGRRFMGQFPSLTAYRKTAQKLERLILFLRIGSISWAFYGMSWAAVGRDKRGENYNEKRVFSLGRDGAFGGLRSRGGPERCSGRSRPKRPGRDGARRAGHP